MKLSHIVLALFLGAGFIFYSLLEIDLFARNSYSDPDPVYELLNKASREMKIKYGWEPLGIFVSSPDGVLRRIGIHFDVAGPLSKEEIRKYLIKATLELEKYLTEEKKIRTILSNYPINEYNVEIFLFFIDDSRNEILSPHIGRAGCYSSKLFYTGVEYNYSSIVKRKIPQEIWTIRESYDEALQALGLPPRNSPPLID